MLQRVALHIINIDPGVAFFTHRATRDRVGLGAHIAVGGIAITYINFQAFEIVARDDVDHAGNSVGTVNGRSTVEQNFNTLHNRHRNAVQVGERGGHVLGHRVIAQPATIHQHERVGHAHAAQRHAGCTRGERVLEFLVERSGVVLRQTTKQLAHGLGTGTVDLLAIDSHDRRRSLQLDCRNIGTGDDNRGQFTFIILGNCRHGGQRKTQTHEGDSLHCFPHPLGFCSICTFHNDKITSRFVLLLFGCSEYRERCGLHSFFCGAESTSLFTLSSI